MQKHSLLFSLFYGYFRIMLSVTVCSLPGTVDTFYLIMTSKASEYRTRPRLASEELKVRSTGGFQSLYNLSPGTPLAFQTSYLEKPIHIPCQSCNNPQEVTHLLPRRKGAGKKRNLTKGGGNRYKCLPPTWFPTSHHSFLS